MKPARTGRVPATLASSAPPSLSTHAPATADVAGSGVWKTLLMGAALLSVACPVVVARSLPSHSGNARSRDGASVNSDLDMNVRQRYVPPTAPSASDASVLDERFSDATTLARAPQASQAANVANVANSTNVTRSVRALRTPRTADANDTVLTTGAASLLSEDWLGSGNLTGFFDGPPFAAFLTEFCGEALPGEGAERLKTRESALLALHGCLRPAKATHRSPWDSANFITTAFDALVTRAGISLGYGAHATSLQDDPTFVQATFVRVMTAMIWPARGDDPATIPPSLRTQWLTWLHPGHQQQTCETERDARYGERTLAVGVPDADLLRARLGDLVFGSERWELGDARSWVYRLAGALIDPALGLPDSMGGMRVGDLPWALTRIGMTMAGPDAWQMSPPELTALAATAYESAIESANDNGTAIDVFFHINAEPILLHAHAQGLIDLRDEDLHAATAMKTAIDAFDERMHRAFGAPAANGIEALRGELPTRTAVLTRELVRQLPDDDALYFSIDVGPPSIQNSGSWLLAKAGAKLLRAVRGDCVNPGDLIAMEDLILDGCMADIDRIDPALGERLHDAGLDSEGLAARFDTEFAAGVKHIRDTILLPALEGLVRALAPYDFRHWTCGEWQIRVPSVKLLVPLAAASSQSRRHFVGEPRTEIIEKEATNVVFIDATMGGTTRHFAVTLSALKITAYDGRTEAWLRASPETLFGPGEGVPKRTPSDVAAYRTIAPAAGKPHESPTRAVAQAFGDRLMAFREGAYGKTPTEVHREAVRRALLGFIPFYNCVEDVTSGSYRIAMLDCGIDVANAIPLVHAAVMAEKAVLQVSRTLVGAVLDDVSQNVVRRAGLAGGFTRVLSDPAVSAAIDVANAQFKHTGVALARFVDPGVELGVRGMLRLPGFGRRWLTRIGSLPLLSRVAERWAHEAHTGTVFLHRDGVWYVPSTLAAELRANGETLEAAGETLELARLGGREHVVVRRASEGVRLVNPHTGKMYGPWLGMDDAGRLTSGGREVGPANTVREAGHTDIRRQSAACSARVRRSPASSACDVLRGPSRLQMRIPQASAPLMYRRRDLNGLWQPVDLTDVAVRVKRVDWPDGSTHDDYWLDGDDIMWRTMLDGELIQRKVGTLSHDLEPLGTAYPDSGYVRVSFYVELDEIRDAEHANRRALLSEKMLENRDKPNRPWFKEESVEIQMALPYAEGVDASDRRFGVVMTRDRAYRFVIAQHNDKAFNIVLKPMTPPDVTRFGLTQRMSDGTLNAREINGNPMLKSLRDIETPALRIHVDDMFTRAGEILSDARAALSPSLSDDARCVLKRFVPDQAQELAEALRIDLGRLDAGLQAVSAARLDVIGVIEHTDGSMAETLSGVLEHLDLIPHLGRPVIVFDTSSIIGYSTEVLASTLLHELSHAILRTRDSRVIGGSSLYPEFKPALPAHRAIEQVEGMSEMVAQGEHSWDDLMRNTNTPRYQLLARDRIVYDGLVPEVSALLGQNGHGAVQRVLGHAASLEHLIGILAYTRRAGQRVRINEFLGGAGTYQRYTPGHTPWNRQAVPD
ncbi:hypothetical protein [Pandoraea sp. PE-S2T-3]|uniref:hypothetical protein n=1 Tax=Pandoraea sp. PE-S2T-3 TaxID=1986993 RepID=UPI0011251741|nr:hypothetical protein [Pandoraea sp. PE-S2T-3]